MITDLKWAERVDTDYIDTWVRTGGIRHYPLMLEVKQFDRKVWTCSLGLIEIDITELDLYYRIRVDGGMSDALKAFSSILGKDHADRDVYRQFIAPDLESAKRGALEIAMGFLLRDLVIVRLELGIKGTI